MNAPSLPMPGQPVTLEAVDELGRRCVFEGLVRSADPSRVALSLALGRDPVEMLGEGVQALVRYADEAGLHYFEAPIVEAVPGARAELILAAPAQVSTSQRRRFMRLGMRIGIRVVRLDQQGAPVEQCVANTLEIGGNGAGIVADRSFKPGERLRFELELGDWGRCSGYATVKRSVLVLSKNGGEYRVALQFTELGTKEQALILSYLLAARRQAA